MNLSREYLKQFTKNLYGFLVDLQKIIRYKPTVVSHNDMIIMATTWYNREQLKHVEDDCGSPFKFFKTRKVLKQQQKFLDAIKGSSSATIGDIDNSSAFNNSSSGKEKSKIKGPELIPVQKRDEKAA